MEYETVHEYNKYARPVSAFITFTNQENKERVLNAFATTNNFYDKPIFKKKVSKDLGKKLDQTCLEVLGVKLECFEATEPTNLKWENLPVHWKQRCMNRIIVLFLLLVFLTLTMILFAYMKQAVVSFNKKYSPTTKCETYETVNIEAFMKMASQDKANTIKGEGLGLY